MQLETRGWCHYWDWLTVHIKNFNIGSCSERISKKIIFKVLTAIKSTSFQRKSIRTLKYYLNVSKMTFVFPCESIRHHNKSYDYETNNENMQKPKIQWKSARRKRRKHLKHQRFSENFISDPLNVFSKPMGAINIWIMW